MWCLDTQDSPWAQGRTEEHERSRTCFCIVKSATTWILKYYCLKQDKKNKSYHIISVTQLWNKHCSQHLFYFHLSLQSATVSAKAFWIYKFIYCQRRKQVEWTFFCLATETSNPERFPNKAKPNCRRWICCLKLSTQTMKVIEGIQIH